MIAYEYARNEHLDDDQPDGLTLARIALTAHIEAFHGGVLLAGCSECRRYERHEDRAAREFAVAYEAARVPA